MSFPLSPLPCPSAAMAAGAGCPDLFLNSFLIHFLILSPLSSNASCTVLPLKSFTPLILSLSHSVVCRVHQKSVKSLKSISSFVPTFTSYPQFHSLILHVTVPCHESHYFLFLGHVPSSPFLVPAHSTCIPVLTVLATWSLLYLLVQILDILKSQTQMPPPPWGLFEPLISPSLFLSVGL